MTRLAWRLARPTIVSSAALLAAVALYAVLTHRAMTGSLHDSGLAACLAAGGDCDQLADRFAARFEVVIAAFAVLNLMPMLIGVFWGGPLIARELEQGTHRLVWTQSHGRGRWLAARLGLHLVGAVAVAAAFTELMTWWFGPVERIQAHGAATFGRLSPDVFDLRGVAPLAYTVFAFAVGTAAGAVLQRTVPAMVATLVLYVPVKALVRAEREHFAAPLTQTYPFGTAGPRAGHGDWQLSHDIADGSGAIQQRFQLPDACRALPDKASMQACVAEHGYRFVDTYQPAGRYWTFQLIESGIFAALAAAALAVAVWWVARRLA